MIIEVCVDDSCETVELEPGELVHLQWGDALRDLYGAGGPGNLLISLSEWPGSPEIPEGSHLRVTVSLDSTMVVLDETVAYEDYRPNGPDCGPVCDHVTYTL